MAILSVDFTIPQITRFCSCQLIIAFITLDYTAITAFMATINDIDTKQDTIDRESPYSNIHIQNNRILLHILQQCTQ